MAEFKARHQETFRTKEGEALIEWGSLSESFDFLIVPTRVLEDGPSKAVEEALAAKHSLTDATEKAAELAVKHGEGMAVLRYDVTRLVNASPVRQAEKAVAS